MRDRKAATREHLLTSAQQLVANAGFSGLQMQQLANHAGVATGTLYRYFPAKEQLAAEVFKRATRIEVAQVAQALTVSAAAPTQIAHALNVFAQRALRAPTLAWALIAEPVEAAVDQQRLQFRQQYAELFATSIQRGIDNQQLPAQNAQLSSTAIVGAIAEALIGPLAQVSRHTEANTPQPSTTVVDDIVQFCLRGLLAAPYSTATTHRLIQENADD